MAHQPTYLLVLFVAASIPAAGWAQMPSGRTPVGLQQNRAATGVLKTVGPRGEVQGLGTGVLVGRFGTTSRLGLLLTASHNVGVPERSFVQFGEARARVLSVALDNPSKEYALMVLKLPRAMKDAPVACTVSGSDVCPSLHVYSVGAVDGKDGAVAVRFGRVKANGALNTVDPRDGRPAVPSLGYSYRSSGGFSGAGVFSAQTGALEALHWGNTELFGFSLRSHAVPMTTILPDIQHHLGSLHDKIRIAAAQLLRSAASTNQQGEIQ